MITKSLKTIFSDVRQTVVGIVFLALVGGTGGLLYKSKTALSFSIALLKTPMPLWATTALAGLCCLYTYVKVAQIQAKLKQVDHSSNNPPYADVESKRRLIIIWRRLVKEIAEEHDKTNTPISNLLERHESYYSLKPHLAKKTSMEISRVRTFIVGSTIPASLQFIINDIARKEKEWGLI